MGAMLLQLFAQLTVASGKLIGAVVVPHGDFAYDPKLVNDTGGSLELHSACERLLADGFPVDFLRWEIMRVEVESLCDMELCG